MDTAIILQEAKDWLLTHKSLHPGIHVGFEDGEQVSIFLLDFPLFRPVQNIGYSENHVEFDSLKAVPFSSENGESREHQ